MSSGLFIFIGIVGFAGLFLWRRIKAADDKLHEERAQREAEMIAQAMAIRRAQAAAKPQEDAPKP